MSAALVALAAAVLVAPGHTAAARLRRVTGTDVGGRRLPRPTAALWVVLGATTVAGLVAGAGGAAAGLLAGTIWARRRVARRAALAAALAGTELADALTRICDELRAGAHPAAALAGIDSDGVTARDALRPAEAALRLGETVPAALARSALHSALTADVDRVAAAWALSDRHGVPLATLLASVATDVRWRVDFGNRVRAELAGPRATATVLTLLPVLGLAFGQLMGADPIGVLRDGLLGAVLLVGGTLLTAAGVAWSERILAAAVPR
ncbi:type II secretion system F family protein [Pseudonocardia sp. N23]|uniref:type II secretion system F family protein n=1 Tax=Pseudonocardia sp. N23 TaxID=1987376 RepID=UPI000BFB6AB3|nr:type II secretion system F family protein [Pseudonocardia sp. N23]